MVWPAVGKQRLQVAGVFADVSASAFVTSAFTASAFVVALEAALAMVEFSLRDFAVSTFAVSVFDVSVTGVTLSLSEAMLAMLEFSFCALFSAGSGVLFAVFTSSSLLRVRSTLSRR
jgi:hypothetical protein